MSYWDYVKPKPERPEITETVNERLTRIEEDIDEIKHTPISDEQLENITEEVMDRVDIPTKVSELDNDSGYIGEAALEGYAELSDLATVATTGSYNDLSNKPTIPDITGYATEAWVEAKGYITSVPDTFASKSWVEGKGYLTAVPDTYATKSYVDTATGDIETALQGV